MTRWRSDPEGTTSDPEQLRAWDGKGVYFCVDLGASDLTVLDTDNKGGKEGDKALLALELDHDDLPETLTVRTPSGGHHRFFRGVCAQTTSRLGEGVDTPGMVPVPGSVVPGKGRYDVLQAAQVASLPDWVGGLAGAPRPREDRAAEATVELDLTHNVEAAVAYLRDNAPEAVEGHGGDATAYKVCCRVRDFGLSQEKAEEIVVEHYTAKAGGSASDADWLREKVESAYRYANAPLGASTAEAAFQGVEVEEPPYDGPRKASSYHGDPPVIHWLVDGWLPKGDPILLTGDGGVGKSLLVMQMAAHIAAGRAFLGYEVEQCKVLHIMCEDDDPEIHRRFHRIRASSDFAFTPEDRERMGENLFFWSRVGKDAVLTLIKDNVALKGPFYATLDRALDEMGPGHKLLVLDTLADVYAGSENDRSAVNQFVKHHVCGLAKKHDCTPLIIGHPPKNGAEYSGSTAWNGAVRSRVYMERHEKETLKDNYRVLRLPKSNRGRAGLKVTVRYESGTFIYVDEVEIVDEGEETNLNLVMEAIAEKATAGTPIGLANTSTVKVKDLSIKGANGKPLPADEIRRLIRVLIDNGDAEEVKGQKSGNGVWPKGRGV